MDKGIHLTQEVDKGPGEAFFTDPFIQSGDIGKGDLGINGLFRLKNLSKLIHTRVGNFSHCGMDFQLPGGKSRDRFFPAGQGLKEGCLSCLGESDYSNLHV